MADGIPYPPSAPSLHFGSYAPGVQPRGDLYLGEGIAGLGQGIAQGIAMYNKNKKEDETRDATFDFLAQNYPETIPQDALERYHSANENQKNKWMLQAYTGYTDMIRKQKMVEDNARAQLYAAQAGALTASPSLTPFEVPGQDTVYGVTQPGHPTQILNKGQPPVTPGEGPNVQFVDDPNNPGKKIPFTFEPGKGWVPVHQAAENPLASLLPFLGGGLPGADAGAGPAAPPGAAPMATPTPAPPTPYNLPPNPFASALGVGTSTAPGAKPIDAVTAQGFIQQAQMQLPDEQDAVVIKTRARQLAQAAGYQVP